MAVKKSVVKSIRTFYAYASEPKDTAETIETAAREISRRKEGRTKLQVKPWPALHISGKPIFETEISRAIQSAQVFACDLTSPNPNVAFELGYAIGLLKRVWISVNVTVAQATSDYKKLQPSLENVGFSGYCNSQELSSAFLDARPWEDLQNHILGEGFTHDGLAQESASALYLKAPENTEASMRLTETLQTFTLSRFLLVDDPRDNVSPGVTWYAEKVRDADVVIAHLLADNQNNAVFHNFKCAVVCGFAVAVGKLVLMLAHEPFKRPVDFRHLLMVHSDASTCVRQALAWVAENERMMPARRKRRPISPVDNQPVQLRDLSVGEYVAEHETQMSDKYFIETSAFYEALEGQESIFVGRRGTGKSANYYALERTYRADRRNHVCTITPVGYEVDALVEVLRNTLDKAERGYLIESLWKYLLLTELLASVLDEIASRPSHYVRTEAEERLVRYGVDNASIIKPPFSIRLDNAVASIPDLSPKSDPNKQNHRYRISELLHTEILYDLRVLLGEVLAKRKVAILIDRLDEPWEPGPHIEQLSELISGLLRVTRDIGHSFSKSDSKMRNVQIAITVFLRSDIFYHVRKFVTEQDKLPIKRMVWNKDLLSRLLDERLVNSVDRRVDAQELWSRFFCTEVDRKPVRDFVLQTAIMRPRDVIFLTKEAIAAAINRGDDIVAEADFLSARRRYSQMIYASILAEDDPRRGRLGDVLLKFAAAPKVVRRTDVFQRLSASCVDHEDQHFYLELLCDLNFLGISTVDGFRFVSDESERQTLLEVAKEVGRLSADGEDSFSINEAFHDVLQIH